MFEQYLPPAAGCPSVFVYRAFGVSRRSSVEDLTHSRLTRRGYRTTGLFWDDEPEKQIRLFSVLDTDMATMPDGSDMSRDMFWDWLDDQLGNAREHKAAEPDPLDPENYTLTAEIIRQAVADEVVGTKHDAGKPRASLLPGDALLLVAKVLTDGASVHGARNWQHVAPERFTDALARHLCKYIAGESHDAESGSPHMAHIAANALFLLHLNPDGVSL